MPLSLNQPTNYVGSVVACLAKLRLVAVARNLEEVRIQVAVEEAGSLLAAGTPVGCSLVGRNLG